MKLADHPVTDTVKSLVVGDSGSGKSGALASLAAAGYHLYIIDLDDGIAILKNLLQNKESIYYKKLPNCIDNVECETLTDPTLNINGQLYCKKATVWQRVIGLCNDWPGKGKITTWGREDTLVIDSLSKLSEAALNFHLQMNGALTQTRTQNEGRRDIGVAQELLRKFLTMLFDREVKCNIIINAHITMVSPLGGAPKTDDKGQLMGGIPVGYPAAVGRALSPHIPRWFNSMLIIKTIGVGSSAKHRICTSTQIIGDQIIAAKNPNPLGVLPEYPLETGLAEYFKAIRSEDGRS